ncbi:PQQ-dependent sugar dehydrogenase [Oceanihabitans sp. 2_MG-2023]|uniref:PQQ-dependent sugar dehydrogenase n=1 Tax=Oceanihabitans sp. 2_MG-2023 TaxID=3062661 RepID=UPI0026E3C4F1|nr:PQQ-dependent sugar dehydrogenase [Oceanihabitans sp. 2_MG-2023]MDO6597161.1 PQQ-dependent sugar dehydrogenase [Oceanihabitans sp. 2_MG-2023]
MKILISLLALVFSFPVLSQTITTELFADGFNNPVDIQNAGDSRLFIVEKSGVIKILNENGTTNTTPFLNIDNQVSPGGERGLLSVAFHPNYTSNGYFYVNFTDNNGATQISRFTVNSANPDIADVATQVNLLNIAQPYGNHNGGCIEFGPDGYLYIGTGDGGSGGDPDNRSQNLQDLLGKMLRIDVNTTSGGNNYAIPADNPFIGNPSALDEIWAYGLRNPWRFSFDYSTNNLWIGDVGQNTTEEINRVSTTTNGYNFGWRCYEGSNPYNTSGCDLASTMTLPVAEYPIPPCFCNVVGGYMYRGTTYADLQDTYIFATSGDGTISTLNPADALTNHGDYGGYWVSFGEDVNKELYIADISGGIYKIKGGILSTPEFNIDKDIKISPNPASEDLKISTTLNKNINSITIFNIKGKVVYTEKNISTLEKEIKVNSFRSGLYLIKITSENGFETIKKIVIQ